MWVNSAQPPSVSAPCAMMNDREAWQGHASVSNANLERSAPADAAPLHTSAFTGRLWRLCGPLARLASRLLSPIEHIVRTIRMCVGSLTHACPVMYTRTVVRTVWNGGPVPCGIDPIQCSSAQEAPPMPSEGTHEKRKETGRPTCRERESTFVHGTERLRRERWPSSWLTHTRRAADSPSSSQSAASTSLPSGPQRCVSFPHAANSSRRIF